MANPQSENGHTDIAHELAEALARINLSAYESRVLWVIFRQTYGWHKKQDAISLGQFEKRTGITRQHITRTIKSLEKRNIIKVSRTNRVTMYQVQKNYELWNGVVPIQVVPIQATRVVPIQATKVVPNQGLTKEKKETIQKKRNDDVNNSNKVKELQEAWER